MSNDDTPLSEEERGLLQTLQTKTNLTEEDLIQLENLKKRHMIENFKPVNPNQNTLQLPSLYPVGTSSNRTDRLKLPPHSLLPNSTNTVSYPMKPRPPSASNNMSLQPNPQITEFTPPAYIGGQSLCDVLGNCIGGKNQVVPTTGTGGKFTKNKRRKLRSSHKKVRAKRSKQNKRKRSSKRHKRYTRKH